MSNKESSMKPEVQIKQTNMIDKSLGDGLGFTSSAPPKIPHIPKKPESKPSKDK